MDKIIILIQTVFLKYFLETYPYLLPLDGTLDACAPAAQDQQSDVAQSPRQRPAWNNSCSLIKYFSSNCHNL